MLDKQRLNTHAYTLDTCIHLSFAPLKLYIVYISNNSNQNLTSFLHRNKLIYTYGDCLANANVYHHSTQMHCWNIFYYYHHYQPDTSPHPTPHSRTYRSLSHRSCHRSHSCGHTPNSTGYRSPPCYRKTGHPHIWHLHRKAFRPDGDAKLHRERHWQWWECELNAPP